MKIVVVTLFFLFGCQWNAAQQLDCPIYTTDKQVIRSLPFLVAINPQGATPIGSFARVIDQGRVTELTLTMVSPIPDSIYCLKYLRTLTIQYGTDLTISSHITRLAPTLTSLTLLRISSALVLPDELFSLTNLNTLSIVACDLDTLPDAIGQLTQLNRLTLSNNRLNSLPSTLGRLTRLIALVLDNNAALTSLKTLNTSRGLQTLSATNCSIEDLPTNPFALATIDLSNNRITSLENLSNLVSEYTNSISLSNNQIAFLPPAIRLASQLQTLDLSTNALTDLPEEVYALKSLASLRLRNNQLDATEKRWIEGRFAGRATNVDI